MNLCLKRKIFISEHIVIRDTFHCKQTMCASRVNGKNDRGNTSEIQAVRNNRMN